MTRSKRMRPILDIAETREKEAATVLGVAQQALEQQQQRLQDLEQYRQEYNAYVQQVGAQGVTASRLQDLYRFVNSLDSAVGQQTRMVEVARQHVAAKLRAWQDARGKHKALGKVIERLQDDEEKAVAKREQKETDEFAQRAGLRKSKADEE